MNKIEKIHSDHWNSWAAWRDEERAEFEKWWKLVFGDVVGKLERLGSGDYAHDRVQIAFDAWMGRANMQMWSNLDTNNP